MTGPSDNQAAATAPPAKNPTVDLGRRRITLRHCGETAVNMLTTSAM
jgi:hypothetical protein